MPESGGHGRSKPAQAHTIAGQGRVLAEGPGGRWAPPAIPDTYALGAGAAAEPKPIAASAGAIQAQRQAVAGRTRTRRRKVLPAMFRVDLRLKGTADLRHAGGPHRGRAPVETGCRGW